MRLFHLILNADVLSVFFIASKRTFSRNFYFVLPR